MKLYLALEHIAKKWTMPVQNWKAAVQRFVRLGIRARDAGDRSRLVYPA
jgi:hypothetical protein